MLFVVNAMESVLSRSSFTERSAVCPSVFVILSAKLRNYSHPGQHGCLRPACDESWWIQIHVDGSKNSETFFQCKRSHFKQMYDFSLFLFFRLREGGGGRTVPSVSRVFALALTSTETLTLIGAVSFPFPFFLTCGHTRWSCKRLCSFHKVTCRCCAQLRDPLKILVRKSTAGRFLSLSPRRRLWPTSCADTRTQFNSTSPSTPTPRCSSSHIPTPLIKRRTTMIWWVVWMIHESIHQQWKTYSTVVSKPLWTNIVSQAWDGPRSCPEDQTILQKHLHIWSWSSHIM